MSTSVTLTNGQGSTDTYDGVSGVELLTGDGTTATFIHDAEIKQTDWNQTDPDARDYLKNKPELALVATEGTYESLSGKIVGASPLFLPGEYEFIPGESAGYYYVEGGVAALEGVTPGIVCTVVWDGVEFQCTVNDLSAVFPGAVTDGYQLGCLGNGCIFKNDLVDTGEPFFIVRSPFLDQGYYLYARDDAAKHTVTVTKTVKLDAAYLPDSVATKQFVREEIAKIEVSGGGSVDTTERDTVNIATTVRMVAEFNGNDTTLSFAAHNGSMILCAAEANEATFTDRNGETKYLIPIPANAKKVEVVTTDAQVTLAQFVGVNGSGGSYTKVFSSAREAVYSYEFEKGAAQWMAIDLIYEDTAAISVPRDYDAATTTTVTFTLAAEQGVTSWNDLKDRPFYGDIHELLASTEAPFRYGLMPTIPVYAALVPTNKATYDVWLAASDRVQVEWDGTVYTCDFQNIGGTKVVGNATIAGGTGNGEPFGLTMLAEPLGDTMEYFLVFLSAVDLPPSDVANAPILTHTVSVALGQIKTLDKKYLPELSLSDLKDSPFIPGSGEVVLPEAQYSGFVPDDAGTWSIVENVSDDVVAKALVPGETYTVLWDGVEFTCVAKETTDADVTTLGFVGNARFMNPTQPDTGEPFAYVLVPPGSLGNQKSVVSILTTDAGESHTISVTLGAVKLDKKFLPVLHMSDIADSPVTKVMTSAETTFANAPADKFDTPLLGTTWHKVFDLAPTTEELLTATLSVPLVDLEWTPTREEVVAESAALTGIQHADRGFGFLICREAGAQSAEFQGYPLTVDVPSPGTYFGAQYGEEVPPILSVRMSYETVGMDKKYLPKAAAIADLTAAPTAEDFNALLAVLREAGYLSI